MTTTVYVLKCTNNKYYVGKTTRSVDVRFEEHCNGSGSEWTCIYQPIRIVESEQITDNSHLELTKTLDYMNKYGIDNVRGGSYCNVNLSETEKENIRRSLSSKNDSCYKCGMTGHFANNCDYSGENNNNNSYYSQSHFANERDNDGNEDNDDNNSYRCYKCGAPGHFANECNYYNENDDDNSYRCYKCGAPGHFANECDGGYYNRCYNDEFDSPSDDDECYDSC